jgi:DNA-binding GntR family transcriptional regulator
MSEATKPVRPAEIFSALKQRILQWRYPPGFRFTEDELCREFGVSRSPVREALRMLEENDLVDKIPYRGCTVKQPDWAEINELYDVRVILETAVAEQLAERGLPAPERAALASGWRELERSGGDTPLDGAALAQLDREFHEALARATGNKTLYSLLRSINERLHFIRQIDITTVERLRDTCQQHIDILDRIADGDAGAARRAMSANIDGARVHVKSAIKEALARAYMEQMVN